MRFRFIYTFVLFLTALLMHASSVFAGGKDSTKVKKDSTNVRYFYESTIDSSSNIDYTHIDTLLDGKQNYNPLYQNLTFFQTTSNIGQAHKNQVFSLANDCGFDYGRHVFDGYLYKYDRVKYYQLNSPYTSLFFVMGAQREQLFNVIHSQNIRKYWNAGVDFNLVFSNGAYQKQRSDDKNLVLFTDYTSKNKKYTLLFNYVFNHLKIQENGGILSDSLFENDNTIKPSQTDINLTDAQNKFKQSSVFLKQYYKLESRKKNTVDTTKIDTTSFGRISHTFLFNNQSQVYQDGNPTGGFYQNVFYDSTITNDSIHLFQIENEISYLPYEFNSAKSNLGIRFFAGIRSQYTELRLDSSIKYFNQFIPKGGINIYIGKRLQIKHSFEYILGDYNDQDQSLNGIIEYRWLSDSLPCKLKIDYSTSKRMPSWMMMQYQSNHFKWDNNFDKINSQTIGTSIQYRALQTGVNYFTITNYVFFDNYIRPLQSPKTIKIFNAFLSKKFTLGRWVLANQIVYQKKLDSTNFIRLPELLSKNSLYFNGSFFKRALIMQIGVDLLYNTKYYADAYSPALAQFYLQNEKKIGDYPYIDIFLVARVKRASIFLKLQHASSGLMERTYYSSPNYPMQGRAIKFGVTWRFYN